VSNRSGWRSWGLDSARTQSRVVQVTLDAYLHLTMVDLLPSTTLQFAVTIPVWALRESEVELINC